jgi:hypothetical protein
MQFGGLFLFLPILTAIPLDRILQAVEFPGSEMITVRVAEPTLGDPLPIVADLPNGIRLRIPTANARLACQLVLAVAGAKTNFGGSR